MKIFISYRRADSTYLIGRIRDRLTTAFGQGSVFRDLDDIPAGIDFRTVLEKETKECNAMLVVIGPQWAGITDAKGNKRLFDPGDYTRIEVETGLHGLAEKRTAVIPVLVMNATMPASSELPESLAQLTYQNAISIRNDPDFNNDIERLIRDIRRAQGYAEEDISTQYFEPKTVYIAQGPFWMGSPALEGIPIYETPQHEVILSAFRIGKYPVTNIQYEHFVSQTKIEVPRQLGWDGQKVPKGLENHPVTGVTWDEARAYCEWLSHATGRQYLLPSEAQWEKACRGGNKSLFPWGNEFDARRCNHGQSSVSPVDTYPAQNEFGCFDLVGNILQWTCTLWEQETAPQVTPYPWKEDGRNNLNANRETPRVLRGSTIKDDYLCHRCSARRGDFPGRRGYVGARYGFRVIMNG
jgi:formylglycine-generating enzyme required for sulfatase activity